MSSWTNQNRLFLSDTASGYPRKHTFRVCMYKQGQKFTVHLIHISVNKKLTDDQGCHYDIVLKIFTNSSHGKQVQNYHVLILFWHICLSRCTSNLWPELYPTSDKAFFFFFKYVDVLLYCKYSSFSISTTLNKLTIHFTGYVLSFRLSIISWNSKVQRLKTSWSWPFKLKQDHSTSTPQKLKKTATHIVSADVLPSTKNCSVSLLLVQCIFCFTVWFLHANMHPSSFFILQGTELRVKIHSPQWCIIMWIKIMSDGQDWISRQWQFSEHIYESVTRRTVKVNI